MPNHSKRRGVQAAKKGGKKKGSGWRNRGSMSARGMSNYSK